MKEFDITYTSCREELQRMTGYFFTIINQDGKPIHGRFLTFAHWVEALEWLSRWGKAGERIELISDDS